MKVIDVATMWNERDGVDKYWLLVEEGKDRNIIIVAKEVMRFFDRKDKQFLRAGDLKAKHETISKEEEE